MDNYIRIEILKINEKTYQVYGVTRTGKEGYVSTCFSKEEAQNFANQKANGIPVVWVN